MTELPERMTPATPAQLARVFNKLAADIAPWHAGTPGIADPRLVAVLIAQSALETGRWSMMRCFNFGNVKATDSWVERGGAHTFFKTPPPHARAPVTETMSTAAAERNLRLARPRPDAPDELDMVIGSEKNGRVECLFWARHPQTRFRAHTSLTAGAAAWLSMLAGKYGAALVPAARGDVAGYCRELVRLGPYFTEDLGRYTRVVEQLYREFLLTAQWHALMFPSTGTPPSTPGDAPDVVRVWQRRIVAYFDARGVVALPLHGIDGDHGPETVAWTERMIAVSVGAVSGLDESERAKPSPLWMAGFAEAGLNPAEMSLGLRCLAWTGYQLGLGVRELPGSRHDARIVAYSDQCRRGGELLGVLEGGAARWQGGRPLELTTDEEHWCATTVSASLLNSMLPGDTPPHGLRVSVAELVADARRAGTLRPVDWVPTPGARAIEGRAGQSPIVGGKGHVRQMVRVDGPDYFGVGGNERNTFGAAWYPRDGRMRRDGHQLVGWIEVK